MSKFHGIVVSTISILNLCTKLYYYLSSKAHTEDAIQWLSIFDGKNETNKTRDNSILKNKDSRPILVCMTFADRLVAEMMDEDGRYDKVKAKTKVKQHFEVVYSYITYTNACEPFHY